MPGGLRTTGRTDSRSQPNASASTAHSIPIDRLTGPDHHVFCVDIGLHGSVTKGFYRLHNLNFDGDSKDSGERQDL